VTAPLGIPRPVAAAKKETSRIPLEAAKLPSAPAPAAGAPAAGAPKTIRIKPVAAPVPGKTIKPEMAAPVETPPSAERLAAAKRSTSRISLDAVLGAEAAAPKPAEGPKTIRLKRPGEASGVKVQPAAMPSAASAPQRPAEPVAPAAPPVAAQEPTVPATVRKTVLVKRPGARPAGEGEGTPATPLPDAALSMEEMGVAGAADEPSWVFSVFAAAAVLVVCVLIYALAAQTFGPDRSLTQLSAGVPDLNLSWPGKISALR
jgi:hypothetical protein